MQFRFRLASLLRIRKVREEIERDRLLRARFSIRTKEDAIAELRHRNSSTQEQFATEGSRWRASEMQFARDWLAQSYQAGESIQALLGAERRNAEQQQLRVQESRRASAVLENLQGRQKKAFLLSQSRDEQKRLDEAFQLTNAGRSRHTLPSE